MKLISIRKTVIIAAVLITAAFAGCEKGDGEADYGFDYVYMPQATTSGGLNNNYAVPLGNGIYTYNYQIDSVNHRLNIILGVSRAGKLPNESFQVDVKARPDTTDQIIISSKIANGVLLPGSMYSLPTQVIVPSDKSGETFYLSVDALGLNNEAYSGKKLVLTVAIDNPTKYKVQSKYRNTVIIIDVNAIRPKLK